MIIPDGKGIEKAIIAEQRFLSAFQKRHPIELSSGHITVLAPFGAINRILAGYLKR